MAIHKGKIFTITSAKGGVGKTTATLNLASVLKDLGQNVLIVDLDIYGGGIALSLNIKYEKDIFHLFDDLNNGRFQNIDNYITKYEENISVLPAPKDPRLGSKMNAKFIDNLLSKVETKFDVILIDTNHVLSEINLVVLDKSDKIILLVTNDPVDLKNMKSLLSIFKDAEIDNYLVVLNNSRDTGRDYFSQLDIKNIIKNRIDFTIPSSFYIKDIDKYVIDGGILIERIHFKNKAIKNFKYIAEALLKEKNK